MGDLQRETAMSISAATIDRLSLSPGTVEAHQAQPPTLASAIEELARLRFSIILTARWEAAETEDADRRDDLRAELADLRIHYSDQIDQIAMTYGVQQAMDAKNEVEHNVFVPRDSSLPEKDQLYY